ncbi:hypothetical protein KAI92_04285 [Candidatus Parcubacteria bacterium]|nr:hypothetical protein [Candidatus Parcubacteria bacterium]
MNLDLIKLYSPYFVLFIIFLFAGRQLFNFLLRGFAPFVPSRPWVVKQLIGEIEKLSFKKDFNSVSIGSGRSGLSRAIEKRYPDARIVGVEDTFISWLISWLQVFFQRSDIIVKWSDNLTRVNVKDKDLVYLKLDVERIRDIDKKLKFECKTGTIVISNGFLVPNFVAKKIVKLDDKKERFAWLGRNRSLFASKRKKYKKENKVYFYEIE